MFDMIIEKLKAQKLLAIICTGLVMVLVCLFALIIKPKSSAQLEPLSVMSVSSTSSSSSKEATKGLSQTSSQSTSIVVDVKGAVQKEGVYTLSSDSRVSDAIQKAGGLSADANKKSINLAQKLTDEALIYVAKEGEDMAGLPQQMTTANASSASSQESDKINLNTARLSDLQTISGIGSKRAQDIIDYRETQGGFASIDDLKNVSGIGDKTLERLRHAVTVD
ncbi:helix-hairpin-helix domain-containing protein [Streptococcus sp. zg-JUN1979]|uniref:helix-hairpin-helix domain-containing protein n=1 Tax=Streptococcus sp. zg-JUN1979 TaxID=3391450 RepID=UPI0039A77FF8